MDVKRWLHRALRCAGYDLQGYVPIAHPLARRARLLEWLGIDLVLDVGANAGQYARLLRDIGYRARIVSFEPLAEAFDRLSRRAARDPRWQAVRCALGDAEGTAELRVAQKPVFSSLHPARAALVDADAGARPVRGECVPVRRLDQVLPEVRLDASRIWLKLDVQGHEEKVLAGLADRLGELTALQIELSARPLYEGERDLLATMQWLQEAGFELWALEPGFSDARSGRMLQMDGIFVLPAALPRTRRDRQPPAEPAPAADSEPGGRHGR